MRVQLTQLQDLIYEGKVCPYCLKPSSLVDSIEVYSKSFGMMYMCYPCGAWVGTHKGTTIALGRLADPVLRHWKKRAHDAFDPIWKSGNYTRRQCYDMLSRYLGTPKEHTHIGHFSVETCKQVIEWARTLRPLITTK